MKLSHTLLALLAATVQGGDCAAYGTAKCPPDQEPNPDCAVIGSGPCEPCVFKNKYDSCGGHTIEPKPCKEGKECRDDPRTPDSCGMACDRPGICVPTKLEPCGGFAGFACPEGLFCYDDPSDDCDPMNGGADCPSFCL